MDAEGLEVVHVWLKAKHKTIILIFDVLRVRAFKNAYELKAFLSTTRFSFIASHTNDNTNPPQMKYKTSHA